MKDSTFDLVKKIIIWVFSAIIIIAFVTLLLLTMDNKFIKNIKEFVKTDTKVLYITDKDNYNEYPIKILDKYEINYKYIDSKKISSFEKNKIERIINNNDLSNIIVIFESGKIKDALLRYDSKKELNEFLIKNGVIPSITGDVSGIKNKVNNALESENLLLYLPYVYNDNIKYQDNLLKNISKQYNIDYMKIDMYLLSKTQHQKINAMLDISDVEDQIILFIKNKEIVETLRGYNRRSEYINKLFEFGYINDASNSLNEISYDEFRVKSEENNKNIFLIIKDDCKYCKETMSLLNQISSLNNLDIDYLNINEIDSDLSADVSEYLKSMGYNDGFSTPLLILTEKSKILDYSIGTSSIEFYEELFKEYGLIK